MLSKLLILISSFILAQANGVVMGQTGPIVDNFKVVKSGSQVLLSWRMLAGNTCNGITIYRSTDTTNFEQIGQIPGICGSTVESIRYMHTDISPILNSKNFYRLEFGGLGISDILAIDIIDLGTNGYQVWPNPVWTEAKIYFNNDEGFEHQINLYDLNGKHVYSSNTDNDYFLLRPTNLVDGVYVFTISNPGSPPKIQGKLLIQL